MDINSKKSPEVDLENKKLTFVLLGLVLALAIMYVGFEWTQREVTKYEVADTEVLEFEEEIIDNTIQEETPPPPPPPAPEVIEEIEIVEDDKETESIDFSTEDDDKKVQEIIAVPVQVEEEDPEENVVFQVVENMPEFPGGRKALMEYLAENIKYPSIAAENNIQGRVVCQFTVWKDGSIKDIVVARGIDPSLDREAIRVVQSMPKWTPGKQRGKAVNCRFTLPILFRLQ